MDKLILRQYYFITYYFIACCYITIHPIIVQQKHMESKVSQISDTKLNSPIANSISTSKVYEMECCEPYFTLLKENKKTVEGRRCYKNWALINPGDIIMFTNNGEDHFFASVTKINKYTSTKKTNGKTALQNYLEEETLEKTLPGVKTIEEGMKIYLQFSSEKDIEKCGIPGNSCGTILILAILIINQHFIGPRNKTSAELNIWSRIIH